VGGARGLLRRVERRWDSLRGARRVPTELRIVTYVAHGAGGHVVVRGRVVDDPEPAETLAGESPWAAVLSRGLGGPDEVDPVFYVSSSPWNLHEFLLEFLAHRGFPAGPVLLRDLVTGGHKHERIDELFGVHADLRWVLLGDSGEHDPAIYAETVRRHPGRVLAVCIREVRLDPRDGVVERAVAGWDDSVPLVLAPDSLTMARRLAELGLVDEACVAAVAAASD
jgi:phosphatidate phosphatase APP1